MASDTETPVLVGEVDARIDTGTIARIVNGGDENSTGVWCVDGGYPLEALETTQDGDGPEDGPEDRVAAPIRSETVVAGYMTPYDGAYEFWAGGYVRHRRREMFGMALLSALGAPARGLWRSVLAAYRKVRSWHIRWYLTIQRQVLGLLVYVFSPVPWKQDIPAIPGDIAKWYDIKRIMVLRWLACVRIARRHSDFGLTMRRRLLMKLSSVICLAAFGSLMLALLGITVGLVTHELAIWQVPVAACVTVTLFVAGFVVEGAAERADTARFDMLVGALPRARQRSEAFWATTTLDAGLPTPVSPRMYPRQPVVASHRRREPEAPYYEAGAWF